MKIDNDALRHRQMPELLKETQILLDYLKTLNYDQLKSMWKSSDNLAEKNFERIKTMNLHTNLTPAILSFEGLQYKYIGANVFTYKELDYIEKHLRVLSGFYGILKPFDGIVPYRLEMQAKLLDWRYKTLYNFWDKKIAQNIFKESNTIVNLASLEYSKSISKYLTKDKKFINCIFGELIEGRVIQKGTLAKMARGEMVRFMAENNIENAEDIKDFNRLSYDYREELSDDNNYVFINKEEKDKDK